MTPEAAERLTIEIANRSGAIGKTSAPAELPKIEGRPRSEASPRGDAQRSGQSGRPSPRELRAR
jgi:hypothetical protein